MSGGLRKRSLNLAGHATSLALEPEFWTVLDAAAAAQGISLAILIGRIDDARGDRGLASACRVWALEHCSAAAPPSSVIPALVAGTHTHDQ
jgi:predicted DNA-binding ribbon-helix-helix protein